METNRMINSLHVNRTAWISLGLVLVTGFAACIRGEEKSGKPTNAATPVQIQQRDWKKFINECIPKVEKSEAVFYLREVKVTGKDVAEEMQENLRQILGKKLVPDPFARNAAITLVMITTHEGIYREGLTGPPEPYVIEVDGKRVKVYDWLKSEFGVAMLPGEEEGHEVIETRRYVADMKPELLAQWEQHIDKCIETVRNAKGVTFSMKKRECLPTEVAAMMLCNKSNVVKWLKFPDVSEKERYNSGRLLVELVSAPLPKRESFVDTVEFSRAMDVWATSMDWVIDNNGKKKLLESWIESQVGVAPPMPKLKKR